MEGESADDGITHNNDIGFCLHVAVLAAAKHVANHLGVIFDSDVGDIGKREMLEGTSRDTTTRPKHHAFVGTEILEVGVDGRSV